MTNQTIIKEINIIGTNFYVYSAYEKYNGHSTLIFEGNEQYGRIGTRPLPPELSELPCGDERVEKVQNFQNQQYEEAYQLIQNAYSETINGNKDMGEIEIYK